MVQGDKRDFVYIALAVGALFGGLYLYTGVWPPVVVVESNSMMHVDAQEYNQHTGKAYGEGVGFGRLGTLDPGDLVLIKEVDGFEEIETFAHSRATHYGDRGDVIAFQATGGEQPTVVHRAMTFVRVSGEGRNLTYTVDWTNEWPEPDDADCFRDPEYVCRFGIGGVTIEPLGIVDQRFLGPGIITQGDNAATNPGADQSRTGDQATALNPQPVVTQQITGVVRGELPAIGLLKLAFSGDTVLNAQIQEHPYFLRIGNMVAPVDLWLLLLGEIATLSAAPVLFAIGRNVWAGRDVERVEELSVLREAWRDARSRAGSPPQEDQAAEEPSQVRGSP